MRKLAMIDAALILTGVAWLGLALAPGGPLAEHAAEARPLVTDMRCMGPPIPGLSCPFPTNGNGCTSCTGNEKSCQSSYGGNCGWNGPSGNGCFFLGTGGAKCYCNPWSC